MFRARARLSIMDHPSCWDDWNSLSQRFPNFDADKIVWVSQPTRICLWIDGSIRSDKREEDFAFIDPTFKYILKISAEPSGTESMSMNTCSSGRALTNASCDAPIDGSLADRSIDLILTRSGKGT